MSMSSCSALERKVCSGGGDGVKCDCHEAGGQCHDEVEQERVKRNREEPQCLYIPPNLLPHISSSVHYTIVGGRTQCNAMWMHHVVGTYNKAWEKGMG
jgi:hypothetical protein